MKIDLNGPVASQPLAERSTRQITNSNPSGSQSATEDRTTLSSDSASIHSLAREALSSPEVRQEKVDALRQSISSGQYQVDATKIAAAIIASKGK